MEVFLFLRICLKVPTFYERSYSFLSVFIKARLNENNFHLMYTKKIKFKTLSLHDTNYVQSWA